MHEPHTMMSHGMVVWGLLYLLGYNFNKIFDITPYRV